MASKQIRTVALRTAVWMALGSAAFVGAFFAGVLVARAKPEPGGGTVAPLSFAGTLKQNGRPMAGKQMLTFTLRKGEVSCTADPVDVEVDADGHFTAPIPLGQEGGCPAGFFDGSDVELEVTVKGATFSGDVSPVPYAKYAEQVGMPDCPAGYERDPLPPNPANPNSILCRLEGDEIVRVGSGSSAFWIDSYEASVWSERGAQGSNLAQRNLTRMTANFLVTANGQLRYMQRAVLGFDRRRSPPGFRRMRRAETLKNNYRRVTNG